MSTPEQPSSKPEVLDGPQQTESQQSGPQQTESQQSGPQQTESQQSGPQQTEHKNKTPRYKQIDPDVARLMAEGLDSRQISDRLEVSKTTVRRTLSWKTAKEKKRKKKDRRKRGTFVVPRTKAGVLTELKESGSRLKDELMRSRNSYQCNYQLIKREATKMCALLEKFVADN